MLVGRYFIHPTCPSFGAVTERAALCFAVRDVWAARSGAMSARGKGSSSPTPDVCDRSLSASTSAEAESTQVDRVSTPRLSPWFARVSALAQPRTET
eukprot:8773391-Prorocentrum_lima.AAC.1